MVSHNDYYRRSHFEAERQKRKLWQINISLLETRQATYKDDEFSTILVFNFTERPLKSSLEMMLLGYVELDEFLKLDVHGLYALMSFRYKNYIGRLNKPKK